MSWRGAGVLRCSSQGEIGLFNQVQAIEYSAADYIKRNRRLQASVVSPQKPAQKTVGDLQQGHEKKSRPRIITIGSPEREGKNENSWSQKKQPAQGFGEFLEACFLCKKKLLPDQKDVYMYQYYCLAAFCSRECRTDQMAVDGLEHEISTDLPRFMTSGRPVRKLQRPREFYLGL